jgi:hypothetical protein
VSLAIAFIILGIVLAIFVHWALGILLVVIGLVLLLIPALSGGRAP